MENETVIGCAIETIRQRIGAACERAGRSADEVRLLPASKTQPASALLEAYRVGITRFGENRVQEVVAKAAELESTTIEFAVIGHLQSNKASKVAELACEFQALDSLKLAQRLERHLADLDKTLEVMIEVNSSAEESKFGLDPADVVDFARELEVFEHLRPIGLMTLAKPSSDPAVVGACFDRIRRLRDDLNSRQIGSHDWPELSMGMSNDFELAIEHGSTCVRVGSAIFGQRS